jgi:hypothetical protein
VSRSGCTASASPTTSLKKRIEGHARGETKLVPIGDVVKAARDDLRRVHDGAPRREAARG